MLEKPHRKFWTDKSIHITRDIILLTAIPTFRNSTVTSVLRLRISYKKQQKNKGKLKEKGNTHWLLLSSVSLSLSFLM